jgi:hypothetical protein
MITGTAVSCVGPSSLFTDSASSLLYVVCNGGNGNEGIYAIATPGGTPTRIATTAQVPSSTSVTKDTSSSAAGTVWIGTSKNGLYTIAPNGIITQLISFTQCPYVNGVQWNNDNNALYVACSGGVSISYINGAIVHYGTQGSIPNPKGIFRYAPNGWIYIAANGGDIVGVDMSGVVHGISPCAAPNSVFRDVRGYTTAACGQSGVALLSDSSTIGVAASASLCTGASGLVPDADANGIPGVSVICPSSPAVMLSLHGTSSSLVVYASSTAYPGVITSAVRDANTGDTFVHVAPTTGTSATAGGTVYVPAGGSTSAGTLLVAESVCTRAVLLRDSATTTLFLGCFGQGILSLSGSSTTPVTLVANTACSSPTALHLSRDAAGTSILYAACTITSTSTFIIAISILPTHVVTQATKDVSGYTSSIYFDTNSGVLFVAAGSAGLIAAFGGVQLALTTSTLAPSVLGISGDSTTGMLYAASPAGGLLSMMQPATMRITSVVPSSVYAQQNVSLTIASPNYPSIADIKLRVVISSTGSSAPIVASPSSLVFSPGSVASTVRLLTLTGAPVTADTIVTVTFVTSGTGVTSLAFLPSFTLTVYALAIISVVLPSSAS